MQWLKQIESQPRVHQLRDFARARAFLLHQLLSNLREVHRDETIPGNLNKYRAECTANFSMYGSREIALRIFPEDACTPVVRKVGCGVGLGAPHFLEQGHVSNETDVVRRNFVMGKEKKKKRETIPERRKEKQGG